MRANSFAPEQYSAVKALDWYRARWQVDLAFKGFQDISREAVHTTVVVIQSPTWLGTLMEGEEETAFKA